MGKKIYFADSIQQSDGSYDNVYGTDDINAIVGNLVGAGIAPFPSKDTYDVSELNLLTSAITSAGVSLGGLKVSFSDNKIHIAQGIGYFENGATIVTDSEGEELDYDVAETLYVYAQYNKNLNVCGFYTSENAPVESVGIYNLILATIEADGTVTDKRVFAQSKIATLGKNLVFDVPFPKETKTLVNDTTATGYSVGETVWEGEVDLSRFNYIISSSVQMSDHYVYTNNTTSISQLNTGPVCVIPAYNSGNCNLYLKKEGSKLVLYGDNTATNRPGRLVVYECDAGENYIKLV